jgi:HNH endonuclease
MGAPHRGKEKSQQQIKEALAARNKARRKWANYLGQDERGSTYLAPCGHVVRNPRSPMCWDCRQAKKPGGTNEFVGRDDRGFSWFKAWECGHVVHGARTKLCRKCWTEKRDRTAHRKVISGRKTNYKTIGGEREHIAIAERALGRKLKKGEIVHHVNMKHTDNRNCNLLICSKEYHALLHYRMQLAWAARIEAQQGA